LAHSSVQVELSGTLQHLLNDLQHVALGFLLPLTVQSTGTHVIEVLQPLEVACSDTSSIAENVRQEFNTLVKKFLLSTKSSGSVGCFHNQLGLELISVDCIDGLFEGSRNEEISKSEMMLRFLIDYGFIGEVL